MHFIKRLNRRALRAAALCLLAAAPAAFAAPPQAPTGLLCELSPAPLGIENPKPSFCWVVNDPDPNEVQSAWRIVVRQGTEKGETVWDSGKVAGAQSINVPYGGPALAPGSVFFWQVMTWDKDGHEGPFSAPQMIVTALKDGWKAKPIWSAGGNFAFIRKEFWLKSLSRARIRRAITFVTARDTKSIRQYAYKFYVNGKLVGVGPARGFGGKTPYNVFDVTDKLTLNKLNVLAAECVSMDPNKDFLMQLWVEYDEGAPETIVTDGTWKALDATAVYNMGRGFSSYYKLGAENIDATKIPAGWMTAGFKDSGWSPAAEKPEYKDSLIAQPMRNIEATEVAPVKVVKKGDGRFFLDFGKEILGCMKLNVDGKAGGKIQVRLGEELSGPEAVRYRLRAGVTYDETWTLRDGPQTLENWGYRGFRYGELIAAPGVALDEKQIKAVVLRYPFDDGAASFTSSDPALNEVWELCKYSVKATSLDVYQDCPTRERGPYEGDAYINQLSHYGVDREFTLPRYSAEYLYYTPTWPTEYKQLSIMQAWEDYLATGNKDSLERNYDVLQTKTLKDKMTPEGLVDKPQTRAQEDLVDWPAQYRDGYVMTGINTVVNAFNEEAMANLEWIADVLGRTTEREDWRKKAGQAREAINARLYDPAAGRYRDGLATSHTAEHASIMPLAFNITPEAEKTKVAAILKAKRMACSVYGAQFLLEALYNASEGQAALDLMTTHTTNSWEHMIHDLGATIVTEAWDPAGKPNMSFAHAWGSAPANIIPRRLMGIMRTGPDNRIVFGPQTGNLKHAAIAVPTIQGTVKEEIENDGGQYKITIDLPANTTATVYVPMLGGKGNTVTVDGAAREGRAYNVYLAIDGIGSGRHVLVRTGQ